MAQRTIALVVLGALAFLPAVAEGEKTDKKPLPKPPETAEPPRDPGNKAGRGSVDTAKKDDAPIVITNETLEARYGEAAETDAVVSVITGPDGTPVVPSEEPAPAEIPDAMQAMRDEQARERDRTLMVARLDREIASMDDRIALLERRILAVRNPFLPRPQVPDDERAAWDLMSPSERVQKTQSEIDDLRRQVQGLRERRDRLSSGR